MDREKTDARNIGRLMNMDRDSIFYVIGTSYAGKSTESRWRKTTTTKNCRSWTAGSFQT